MPENNAPAFGTQFLADAKGADAIMLPLPDAVCLFAGQDIDQIFRAKALARAIDAGQGFLRGNRGIPYRYRFQAGIAVAARLVAGRFAKIAE